MAMTNPNESAMTNTNESEPWTIDELDARLDNLEFGRGGLEELRASIRALEDANVSRQATAASTAKEQARVRALEEEVASFRESSSQAKDATITNLQARVQDLEKENASLRESQRKSLGQAKEAMGNVEEEKASLRTSYAQAKDMSCVEWLICFALVLWFVVLHGEAFRSMSDPKRMQVMAMPVIGISLALTLAVVLDRVPFLAQVWIPDTDKVRSPEKKD